MSCICPSISRGTSYTATRPAGIVSIRAHASAAMRGRRISSRRARLRSSEKTRRPRALRSREPSGARIPSPNSATTAARPSLPGLTTSRATSSALVTTAPRSFSRAATVDLPEPMPPVSPTRRTRSVGRRAVRGAGVWRMVPSCRDLPEPGQRADDEPSPAIPGATSPCHSPCEAT